MDAILEIANGLSIPVIEEAAQAHGTLYRGRKTGTLCRAGCFSFYPSKNLGAFGDGGAVATDDPAIAERLRELRNYGQKTRYFHETIGFNSRLDELQAAILRKKLPYLDSWNRRRRQISEIYYSQIDNPLIQNPREIDYGRHNYHLYVIRCSQRDALQKHLSSCGVNTLIHYPVPIHLQEAYKHIHKQAGSYPIAEKLSGEILSLPVFPELTDEEAEYVANSVNKFRG
jgi:dTDP-4-amino-4,6-dideoxygalactose transaminase